MSSSLIFFSTFNSPSLNGLVNVNADTIATSSLQVNGTDIGLQVNQNTTNLTGITYTPTPPTTNISNNVTLTNSTIDLTGDINIRDRNNPTTNYMIVSWCTKFIRFFISIRITKSNFIFQD